MRQISYSSLFLCFLYFYFPVTHCSISSSCPCSYSYTTCILHGKEFSRLQNIIKVCPRFVYHSARKYYFPLPLSQQVTPTISVPLKRHNILHSIDRVKFPMLTGTQEKCPKKPELHRGKPDNHLIHQHESCHMTWNVQGKIERRKIKCKQNSTHSTFKILLLLSKIYNISHPSDGNGWEGACSNMAPFVIHTILPEKLIWLLRLCMQSGERLTKSFVILSPNFLTKRGKHNMMAGTFGGESRSPLPSTHHKLSFALQY